MTVTADSYEAKALEFAVAMLAASATFRTLVSATTSDGAKAFIVETHSGSPGSVGGRLGKGKAVSGADLDLNAAPFAIVGMDGVETNSPAVAYADYEFTISIRLVLQRFLPDELPAESMRRAWNVAGAVRAEMQAQVGGASALADCEINSSGLFLEEEGGVHKDHTVVMLTITARG